MSDNLCLLERNLPVTTSISGYQEARVPYLWERSTIPHAKYRRKNSKDRGMFGTQVGDTNETIGRRSEVNFQTSRGRGASLGKAAFTLSIGCTVRGNTFHVSTE